MPAHSRPRPQQVAVVGWLCLPTCRFRRRGRAEIGGPSVFIPWTRGNGHERFFSLVVAGLGRGQLNWPAAASAGRAWR